MEKKDRKKLKRLLCERGVHEREREREREKYSITLVWPED